MIHKRFSIIKIFLNKHLNKSTLLSASARTVLPFAGRSGAPTPSESPRSEMTAALASKWVASLAPPVYSQRQPGRTARPNSQADRPPIDSHKSGFNNFYTLHKLFKFSDYSAGFRSERSRATCSWRDKKEGKWIKFSSTQSQTVMHTVKGFQQAVGIRRFSGTGQSSVFKQFPIF